jgi:hypothetical protein
MVAPGDSWAANANTAYTIDTSGTVFSNTAAAGMSCYIQGNFSMFSAIITFFTDYYYFFCFFFFS